MKRPIEPLKLSRELARQIIDRIISEKLPDGADLGIESELLRRYGVSRGTFREALRQLEWQGILRAQRGVNGGIRVARPDGYVAMFTIKVFFELARIEGLPLRQAFRATQEAHDFSWIESDNAVLALFSRALDGQFIAAIANQPNRKAKRSEAIAYQITLEIEDRNAVAGDALGNEAELLARFNVGRGVLREALHLMELNKVIELRRGPSGGAFVHAPTPDFAIYVSCAYLALSDIGPREIAGAQCALLLAIGVRTPIGASCPGSFPAVMRQLAEMGLAHARTLPNIALEVVMRVFLRYWRDFWPAGALSQSVDWVQAWNTTTDSDAHFDVLSSALVALET